MSTYVRQQIDRLLSTELERAEFLKLCGVALLSAVGIGGVLKALTTDHSMQTPSVKGPQGYGGHAFGE